MSSGQLFSASSINTFLRCAKQWEYAYVYELRRPPTVRLVVGLSAHAAVETNYRQKMETETDLSADDVSDAFVTEFDRRIVEAAAPEPDEEQPGQAKDSGIKSVRVYHRDVAPAVQPLMVEEDVAYSINGIPFTGYIDLVDQNRRIRDAKFVSRKPSGSEYNLSMVNYALGFREKTGEVEQSVQLDYVVRTQKPYYWPIPSEGPVPDAAINTFASIVERVDATVQAGVFLPTGLNNNACSWCGYRDICPDYIGSRR